MGFCYAITSGKGGTGKSTVAAGLGIAFAEQGKRTLLVDMDEGLRCLDIMLGIESKLVFDLSDILDGRNIEDAVYPVQFNELLSIIPAPLNAGRITAPPFADFCSEIVQKYDIVIFDFPAGIDFSLYKCLPKGTVVLAVCNPDPVSVRDAAAVCDSLPIEEKYTRLIINKFVYKSIIRGFYANIDSIIDNSGFRLVGIIPDSTELLRFPVNHKLKRNGRAMRSLRRIADRLCGVNCELPKPKKI